MTSLLEQIVVTGGADVSPGLTGRSGDRTPYGRYVAVMKLLLPAVALVLFLVILIWPLTNSREFSFLLSKTALASSTERLRMERPEYNGTDSKGRPFVIRASRALQRSSRSPTVELENIAARITLEDGPAAVDASRGVYDMESQRLTISGDIVVTGPREYRFSTPGALVDLASRSVSGLAIDGSGELGSFQARRFVADLKTGVIVFDGGARLHVVPQRKG